MPLTIFLDPYTELIVELGLAVFIAFFVYLIHLILKPRHKRVSSEASDMYIGGEKPEILSRPYAPTSGLYWGFVRAFAKRVYMYIRYVMHSGILTTWATYMAGWFGFLLVLALLSIALALTWG